MNKQQYQRLLPFLHWKSVRQRVPLFLLAEGVAMSVTELRVLKLPIQMQVYREEMLDELNELNGNKSGHAFLYPNGDQLPVDTRYCRKSAGSSHVAGFIQGLHSKGVMGMRFIVSGFLLLCFAVSPAFSATGDALRYGLQTSLNSYRVDDPAASTAPASGLSLSGIALLDVGRDSRLMFNLNHDAFTLVESNTNMGQNVSSIGGGLSYQKMLRITRTWKPWIGAGLGYTSTSYTNRELSVSTGSPNSYLYADRKTLDTSLLLNANSEWQYNRDWDIGLQVQFAKTISDKSSILRVGIYAVY